MDGPYKVVVVDDQLIARGYMEYSVRATKGFAVVAVLASAQEALDYCREHPLDLLIMDIMMKHGVDGLSAARLIKQQRPQVKIILATSLAEPRWLAQAREAGIESFWFMEGSEMPLQEIMERTMAGESVYDDKPPAVNLGNVTSDDLSPKQKELLRYLTAGLSDREIGEKMGVSPTTVRTHLDRIMIKTGIHTRTELAVKVGRLGLVVTDQERLESVHRKGKFAEINKRGGNPS
ncbi:MAG: response regulator transcription factor [Clostridia bacterium]|nr:response regulator transcription factor [Clostridia bacterium]